MGNNVAYRSIIDEGLVPVSAVKGFSGHIRAERRPGDLLRYCLGRIDKQEAAAVRKVIVLDWSLSKTARAFHCSRDKVRRLLRSAWASMKELLTGEQVGRAPRQTGRTPRISSGSHTSVAGAGSHKTVLKFEGVSKMPHNCLNPGSVAFDEMAEVPPGVFAELSNRAGGERSEIVLN